MDGATIIDDVTPIDLASLPARLDRLATPTTEHLGVVQPENSFLNQLVQFTRDVVRAEHVLCRGFEFESSDATSHSSTLAAAPTPLQEPTRRAMENLADVAARSLRTEVRSEGETFLIATVARQVDQLRVVVSRLKVGKAAVEPFVLTQQLITASISTWDERRRRQQLSGQLDSRGWTAELIQAMESSNSWLELSNRLVDITSIHLQAHQVAFCTRRSPRKPLMDVTAVGGNGAVIDDSLWQMAAAETVLRNAITIAPSESAEDRVATMAHLRLAESVSPDHHAVSIPLRNDDREIIAVLVLVGRSEPMLADSHLRWIEGHVAPRLVNWKSAHTPPLKKLLDSIVKTLRTRRGVSMLTIALCIAAMLPIHYQVSGEAVLVPHTKNFVVAPHDGSLRTVHVRVGDLIRPGAAVAELDDRVWKIEMASLIAERDRAAKQRDVYRAEGKIADEQLAEAELARVNERIKLARHRLDNLVVASPIGGVVLSGELEGVTGAAVQTGQVLAEVAELDQLSIEIAVPQEELGEVAVGQSIRVALDADVVPTLRAKIDSISPSAQTRNGESVFVVRALVDNSAQRLRPGLTGSAKIESSRRPFWKIAFRRLWHSLGQIWV